jgi:hypothetical protein
MKKMFITFIMLLVMLSILGCGEYRQNDDPVYVNLVETLESNYGVSVEKIYTYINIDPNYESDNSFIYFTKVMEKQLDKIRYDNHCNLAWLHIAYVLTDEGDKLVFYVPQIQSLSDMNDAVIMIDYPYEYTAEAMKEYLQNLELDEPLLIDFDKFVFYFHYKHNRSIIPPETLLDKLFQSGCFSMNVSTFTYLNADFNPAAYLNSDFVWIFDILPEPTELRKIDFKTPIWYDYNHVVNYRVFVLDGTVYVTKASQGFPESYIYPLEETITT